MQTQAALARANGRFTGTTSLALLGYYLRGQKPCKICDGTTNELKRVFKNPIIQKRSRCKHRPRQRTMLAARQYTTILAVLG